MRPTRYSLPAMQMIETLALRPTRMRGEPPPFAMAAAPRPKPVPRVIRKLRQGQAADSSESRAAS